MGKIVCCDGDGDRMKRGPWTPEEDQKLIDYIKKHGHGRWRTLPKNAGLKRCGKSCRLRWTNYLRPDIKRGRFSFEEEEAIIQLHSVLGNKWSAIAARLPGRTDNEIKNYWNTQIRKRLLKMGIDPITHAPRLDLLELSSLLSSTLWNATSSLGQNPNYQLGNTGPIANRDLLNLATTFLSYQPKSSTSGKSTTTLGLVPQNNVHENNLGLDHAPRFQSLQQNQLRNPLIRDEIQTCTASTTCINSAHVPCMNETQLMQAKMEQLSQTLATSFITSSTTSTNCPNNSFTNTMWHNNVQADQAFIASSESFAANNMGSGYEVYRDSTQSSTIINSSSENQAFVSYDAPNNTANMSFSSLISTPSSSPYVNYTSSGNTTHEDERDSFCSNMFMYDIADFLPFNGNELV